MSHRKRKKTPSLPSGDHRPDTTGHRSCQPTAWSHSPSQTNSLPPSAHSLSRHQAIAKNRPTATSVSWETRFFHNGKHPLFIVYPIIFNTNQSSYLRPIQTEWGQRHFRWTPCRFARKLRFILWGITSPFLNVPQRSESVAYLSPTYLCMPLGLDVASFLILSFFDMFPSFFPF